MNKIIIAALSTTALFAAPVAMAEGWYADVGYTLMNLDLDTDLIADDLSEVDFGSLTGRLGFDINKNFSVETELGVGLNEEEISDGVTTGSIGLNYLIGLYGKAQLPLNEVSALYARVGIVNAEVEDEYTDENISDTGAAYGVGGTYSFNEKMYVRGDYTRYDIEDVEANTWTISLGMTF